MTEPLVMNGTLTTNRFERQQGLIDSELLRRTSASIVGVGAIGRQVALQLASLGIGALQLVDFDTVEHHNVTTQGYCQNEVGLDKVTALEKTINRVDPTVTVDAIRDRFRPGHKLNSIVFCCVDSISARAAIWKVVQNKFTRWIDGRMLGEVFRVLVAFDQHSGEAYGKSLFVQSEAQTGSCTSRATIYTASIAAGFMVHQFSRPLRMLPIDVDLQVNLLSSEISTN